MSILPQLLLATIFLIIIVGVGFTLFQPAVLARFAPIGTPRILAWIRIIVVSTALVYVLDTDFVSTAIYIGSQYSSDFYTPVGLLTPLLQADWFAGFLGSTLFLGLYKTVTIGALVLALIGYRTRLALVVSWFLYFLYTGIILQPLLLSHYGVQALLLLGIIIFFPTNGAYAIDAKHHSDTKNTPTAQHTLAVFVTLIALCVPYFFAVINKFMYMGFDWFQATNVRGNLHDGLYVNSSSWLWDLMLWATHLPDWVFFWAGIAVMGIQACYVLILFSYRARLVLPAGIISLHIAIYLFMGFWFIDLIMLQTIVYLVAYYSQRQTLPATKFNSSVKMRYGYMSMALVFVFGATLCTIFAVKYHPFTSWSVYATASSYYQSNTFHHSSLKYTLADGSEVPVSIADFMQAVGLYSYPRQSCYWPSDLRRFHSSCGLFFNRSGALLNDSIYSDNPVVQISVLYYVWHLEDMQATTDPLLSTSARNYITFPITVE